MLVDAFSRQAAVIHRMTRDFMLAVPDDRWDCTPVTGTDRGGLRQRWRQFAPLSRQFRHVVRARAVYTAALESGRLDWSRHRELYSGEATRSGLLAALDAEQRSLETVLATIGEDVVVDIDGTPFSLALFAGEFIQHESLHHGQWSVYAVLGGFETPASWHSAWDL